MEKSKLYPQAYFSADNIQHVLDKFVDTKNNQEVSFYYLTRGDESWRFENEREYFAEYKKDHDNSFLKKAFNQFAFKIRYFKDNYTDISVQASTSKEIDRIFDVFERLYSTSKAKV
jgi:hypothetical protein